LLSSAADVHCDSGLSSALSDAAAASRIAEMEAELAQLRQQLALIVMAQEQATRASMLIQSQLFLPWILYFETFSLLLVKTVCIGTWSILEIGYP